MAASARESDKPLTILFDRDCSLCTWTVRRLAKWDRHGRLAPVALQDADALPDRPDLADVASRYPLERSLHVVMPDGGIEARGRAMLAILDALPGGWLLRPWTLIPGMIGLVDRVYDQIAARRHALGGLVTRGQEVACEVPPQVACEVPPRVAIPAGTKPSEG